MCIGSIFCRCSALTCHNLCQHSQTNINNSSIKDFWCNIINGDLACQETEQNITHRGDIYASHNLYNVLYSEHIQIQKTLRSFHERFRCCSISSLEATKLVLNDMHSSPP